MTEIKFTVTHILLTLTDGMDVVTLATTCPSPAPGLHYGPLTISFQTAMDGGSEYIRSQFGSDAEFDIINARHFAVKGT